MVKFRRLGRTGGLHVCVCLCLGVSVIDTFDDLTGIAVQRARPDHDIVVLTARGYLIATLAELCGSGGSLMAVQRLHDMTSHQVPYFEGGVGRARDELVTARVHANGVDGA